MLEWLVFLQLLLPTAFATHLKEIKSKEKRQTYGVNESNWTVTQRNDLKPSRWMLELLKSKPKKPEKVSKSRSISCKKRRKKSTEKKTKSKSNSKTKISCKNKKKEKKQSKKGKKATAIDNQIEKLAQYDYKNSLEEFDWPLEELLKVVNLRQKILKTNQDINLQRLCNEHIKRVNAVHINNNKLPRLGYNHHYSGLLWSQFNHIGFKKMISLWKNQPLEVEDQASKKTFRRTRTLLEWCPVDPFDDLRFAAKRMLSGSRYMAIYPDVKESAPKYDEDALLPIGYQVFRKLHPFGRGMLILRRYFVKRTRERRWFARMVDERVLEKLKAEKDGKKDLTKRFKHLNLWNAAEKDRRQTLYFKVKKEPKLRKYVLFRHIKDRRRWGNSLFVYFGQNAVLISTDELV